MSADAKYHQLTDGDAQARHGSRKRSLVLSLSILLNVILSIICVALIYTPRSYNTPFRLYSPAQDVVSYENVEFSISSKLDGVTTIYQGGTDEADSAWEDLFQWVGRSRVDASEAEKLPTTISLIPKDPDHYAITLDVIHQLHCLNTVRKLIWPDKYQMLNESVSNVYGKTVYERTAHFDHCVDSIRQSLQCSADISVISWETRPNSNVPTPNLANRQHTCRNWDAIYQWVSDRQISDEEWESLTA